MGDKTGNKSCNQIHLIIPLVANMLQHESHAPAMYQRSSHPACPRQLPTGREQRSPGRKACTSSARSCGLQLMRFFKSLLQPLAPRKACAMLGDSYHSCTGRPRCLKWTGLISEAVHMASNIRKIVSGLNHAIFPQDAQPFWIIELPNVPQGQSLGPWQQSISQPLQSSTLNQGW